MAIDATASVLSTVLSLPELWAYLDPGAGSMMLQVLLASVLSSVFFLKSWFRTVREGLLVKNKKG